MLRAQADSKPDTAHQLSPAARFHFLLSREVYADEFPYWPPSEDVRAAGLNRCRLAGPRFPFCDYFRRVAEVDGATRDGPDCFRIQLGRNMLAGSFSQFDPMHDVRWERFMALGSMKLAEGVQDRPLSCIAQKTQAMNFLAVEQASDR